MYIGLYDEMQWHKVVTSQAEKKRK